VPVAGRVLDARTRRPVVGAVVESAGLRALSAEDGRFDLGRVSPDQRVVVRAPSYRAQRLRPSESLLVQLRPLQAQIEVTSSLTGEGLAARFEGPFLAPERKNGAFTIYGIGPGDSVKVAAFAHEPATVQIDEAGKAKVILEAVRVDPSAVFSELRGFVIEDVPPQLRGVQEQLEARIRSDPKSFAGSNPATAVRLLAQGNNGAVVMAVAVEPAFMAQPQVLKNFAGSLATGTRSAAEQRMLDGEVIYVGDSEGGFKWVVLQRFSVLLAVFSTDDVFAQGVAKVLMDQLS
jgi:hypothetical protein